MRQTYGTTLQDIWGMTWREFRVLFDATFSERASAEPESDEFDWNEALDKATGRETPQTVRKTDIKTFMETMM